MELIEAKKKQSGSSSMVAPGFRFHPTDEELVRYYLRRKVCGKGFRIDAISDIDIYKAEPWDLPSMSRLQTRDIEWYFFSVLDKKYGNGSRTNRATEKGYWKTTGKDRAVYHRLQIVGMKKTLVYHNGRAPKGLRSNWVMHEYRLTDQELERTGIVQDAYVLCRVFQKSGTGPKNGEKYGAPFVEEEWEDDELEMVLKEAPEEFDFGDDAYLDGHDLEQILGSDIPSDAVPLLSNFPHADGSYDEETTESINDAQNFLVSKEEQHCEQEQHEHKNLYDLPNAYDMEVKSVKHECMGESSMSGNLDDLEYLLDEPFLDASDNLKYSDGGFIEANDIPNAAGNDASAFDMLDEYFSYFDANTDNSQFFAYDSEAMMGSEDLVSDQASLPQKEPKEGTEQASLPNGEFTHGGNNDTTLPPGKLELTDYKSDFNYPFLKQASQMLGSISAPPAFAAEFPSKDAMRRLNSAAQSSSHVTAGMIQIRNMNILGHGHGTDPSSEKHDNFNIILSFDLARGEDGSTTLESSVSMLPGKTGWLFCFMFLWVLFLSVSFKVGTFVCAN